MNIFSNPSELDSKKNKMLNVTTYPYTIYAATLNITNEVFEAILNSQIEI